MSYGVTITVEYTETTSTGTIKNKRTYSFHVDTASGASSLITETAKKTLPLVLIDYKGEYFTSYSMQFAAILVASLPMVVMYLFMQRTFQAGLTAGAVKG